MPEPHSPYSHAVVANGFVFVSGQVGAGNTIQEQTRQALRNVEAILKASGTELDEVVKVTVLLARPELFRQMNEAYAEFFPKAKPARSVARLGVEIPGVLISIDAIATVPRPAPEPYGGA